MDHPTTTTSSTTLPPPPTGARQAHLSPSRTSPTETTSTPVADPPVQVLPPPGPFQFWLGASLPEVDRPVVRQGASGAFWVIIAASVVAAVIIVATAIVAG